MRRGQRVAVLRWHKTGRPKAGEMGTTYYGTVVKLNGSSVLVQCDNNGPRVWVRVEKVTAVEPPEAPGGYAGSHDPAAADPAGCTQAAEASAWAEQ